MRALAAAAAALVLAAGCVNYPMVTEVGGIRILPANGRVVRQGDGAVFVADIDSTGKYGDTLTHVEAPFARRAQLVDAKGAPLARLRVPGASLLRLQPEGTRVVLSDLTRALTHGEVVIVTLFFEKSGAIGVISPVQ